MFPRHRLRSVAVAVTVVLTMSIALTASSSAVTSSDALHRKVASQLAAFTTWLSAGGAFGHGYVGEVGWPGDDPRWGELAAGWYRQADQQWLWASAWAAGDWWPSTYPLRVYGNGQAGPQATVVEAQAARKRSVNLAGAEFGTPAPLDSYSTTFSNTRRGVVGTTYAYPTADDFAYLASRGITMVRLPFRWERIQPVLNGALDVDELSRLTTTVAAARTAGIGVILDVHNYGAYWQSDAYGTGWRKPLSTSGYLRVDAFVDLWLRLSAVFTGTPGVVAYDLMNEPVGMPGGAATWETASQAVVSALRAHGDTTQIMVAGYNWAGPASFPVQHPHGPWIHDPVNRTFYEAHQYFDCDGSGKYRDTYDAAVSCAVAQGY
jgi:hypothetical protein